MSKSQDRPCNETRGILCAKCVDVHKVMVHAKFRSSMPFEFKQRFLRHICKVKYSKLSNSEEGNYDQYDPI